MLICNNINHKTHHADGSYHHLEVPYLKVTPGVPVIIDGDDDDGKQILINILSGLTFAQGSDIKLFSSSPFALSLQHRHQTIGYFGDKDNFKPLWSVRDNLDLFSGGTLDEILCRNLFEFFELDYVHFIDKEYGVLDEEIQMVLRAIGCFIAEPRAYFLHLPFCILPTHFHLVLCELLMQQQDNIVVISHQQGHFLPLEGDKYSLYEGKLWYQGKLVQPDAAYLAKQTPTLQNIGQKPEQKPDLSLENLVQQFPLPEHKEQMIERKEEAPEEESNVFAKFLTPIDDDDDDIAIITAQHKQSDSQQDDLPQSDSLNIEAENSDDINDEVIDDINDEPNDDITYQGNDDSHDAIIDEANDINMNDAGSLTSGSLPSETADMMVDLQMEDLPYSSSNPMMEQDTYQEMAQQEITTQKTIVAEPIIAEPIIAEPIIAEPIIAEPIIAEPIIEEPIIAKPIIAEPIIAEPIIAEPIIEEPIIAKPIIAEPIIAEPIIEEPIIAEPIIAEPIIAEPIIAEPIIAEPIIEEIAPANDVFSQETLETTYDAAVTQEAVAEITAQTIISQEVMETLPSEIIGEEIEEEIKEEIGEEEIEEIIPIETITPEALSQISPQRPAEIILTEKTEIFQQNKHDKFAYQPLDDNDTEIYQPTPSHFNHEPFIPPHSDNPDIIAKFEQHLHHVPEIGSVFQYELGQNQPIISDDSPMNDDNKRATDT